MAEEKKSRRRRVDIDEGHHELPHDESNWLVSYADMMTLLFGFFVLMYAFSRIDKDKFEVVSKEVAKYFGGKIKENPAFVKLKEKIKEELQNAGIQDDVKVTSRGNDITLRFDGEVLFRSGSAQLLPKVQPTMTRIIQLIKAQNKIKEVIVEGHTDDDPIFSPIFPTNWELSAARATRVVRQFQASGFPEGLLKAEGYGSSRPALPNRDKKGMAIEANQAANRRVIINVNFGPEPMDVIEALETKKFKNAGTEGPKGQVEKDILGEIEADVSLTPEEKLKKRNAEMQRRVKEAQQRLKEAQTRFKEAEKLAKERARFQQMQQQIHQLEGRTKDVYDRLQHRQPSATVPPNSVKPEAKTMTLKQGISALERRRKQPATKNKRVPQAAPSQKARTKSLPTQLPLKSPQK